MNHSDINKYIIELKHKWGRRDSLSYTKIEINKCGRNEENRKLKISHRNICYRQDASMDDAKISRIGTGCFHNLKVSSQNIY